MGDNDKFLTPGTCPVPSCEVVLVLEDKSRLYACKHRLADISKFFLPLLHGDWKEKHMDEIEINDVSKADLLLFLQCTAEQTPTDPISIPSDGPSLCTLISLADQYMCQLLKDRILAHLSTDAMFEVNLATKQALIETAFIHRDGCVEILEACVRLCATMEIDEVEQLHHSIEGNTLAAIYALKARGPAATRNSDFRYCEDCGCTIVLKAGAWGCTSSWCVRGRRYPRNYKQFRELEVKKDLLTK